MTEMRHANQLQVSRGTRLEWTLVVAIARNGVIGRGNALPWKIRSDLRRFKEITMGQCLLMGRKTFESIGKPLPGRQTIVLSRQGCESPQAISGVQYASSLDQVEALVEPHRQIMVVGGTEIFRAAIPRCSRMWITRVDAAVVGDVFFPEVDWSQWLLTKTTSEPMDSNDEYGTSFELWHRKSTD